MPTAKYVGVFLLLSVTILANASAADLRCDKADAALDSLKTWNDLRLWYENYPAGCDSGDIAEGLDDFVVVSLAKRWETLPSLQTEIMKNNGFRYFVLKHITATIDYDDLRMVVRNANTKCPSDFRLLCKEIEKEAAAALKEGEEIDKLK